MSGGDRSYIHKAQLRKKLHIKCMKPNRQLKVNFLAGKQNMKQYRPKNVSCVRVLSITMLCLRVWGNLVFLAIINFPTVNFF